MYSAFCYIKDPVGAENSIRGLNQVLWERLPGHQARSLRGSLTSRLRAVKSQPEVEGLESSPRRALPTSVLALCRASSLGARRRIRRSKGRSSFRHPQACLGEDLRDDRRSSTCGPSAMSEEGFRDCGFHLSTSSHGDCAGRHTHWSGGRRLRSGSCWADPNNHRNGRDLHSRDPRHVLQPRLSTPALRGMDDDGARRPVVGTE